jgi:MFS family permease
MFMIAHAVGQGAVIWVFITEIFPTRVRAYGQSWGSGMLNGFAGIVSSLGAVVIGTFSTWIIFAGFAILMIGQLLFTHFMMPETKGVSLEELERKLVG